MKSKSNWLFALILAVVLPSLAHPAHGSQAEEEAVHKATTGFYSALNALFTGKLEPMKEAWSHANDVTYMGPDGGFQVGWPQVLADWKKQAAMKLGGKVEPDDLRITVGRQLAIVQNHEKGTNINAPGKPGAVSIRATSIFRKEAGEWKMIGHHTDLLPYLKR